MRTYFIANIFLIDLIHNIDMLVLKHPKMEKISANDATDKGLSSKM